MPQFMRKNPDPSGNYHLAYKEELDENGVPKISQEVKIEGRMIFDTNDKELIEILRNDPEISEVDKKARIIADRKDAE